ncbi:MAG: class I SAM-dependent methyltransferase [Bacteroidetes bacterium]|nr:class I SAM-dependent methyltransferase [Bacteroidota bacterium]
MSDKNRVYYSEKYLKGKGVELGALHSPLPFNKEQSHVSYADKYSKEKLIRLFPELIPIAETIVSVDILFDVNSHDFSIFKSHRYDFFIANHLIEHLINPIQFLENMNDVMAEGSILYLAVPDKDFTFDKNRKLTDVEHLWQEYKENENNLSLEHLNDFIVNITKDHMDPKRREEMYFKGDRIPFNWFKRKKIYNLHKERSIHVHVWNQKSFDDFLHFSIKNLKLGFEIIDSSQSYKNEIHEMIYIIKKTDNPLHV